eukprot:SAG31_NODE_7459_length_1682_cov_2.472854_2_plen_317_part_01
MALHHIAGDGWSFGVLMSELHKLYDAATSAEPLLSSPPLEGAELAAAAGLPPLDLQYTDFAHWQRELLSVVSEPQLEYWKARLGTGGPAPLELPTDRPRPKLQSFRGANVSITIPGDVVSGLEAVARRSEATLFMVLLGAFQLLLGRHARQEEVCVGTPYAGRDERGTEGLVGYFINTLPMMVSLGSEGGGAAAAAAAGDENGNEDSKEEVEQAAGQGLTVSELMSRVRSSVVGAFGHSDVPFVHIKDSLGVAQDASRSPVFQAMFVLQEASTDDADTGTAAAVAVESGDGTKADDAAQLQPLDEALESTAKFDLTL